MTANNKPKVKAVLVANIVEKNGNTFFIIK